MADEVRDNEREETPEWAQNLQQAMEKLTATLTSQPQETSQVVEVPVPPTPEETELEQEVEQEQEQEQETPKPKKKSFLSWFL